MVVKNIWPIPDSIMNVFETVYLKKNDFQFARDIKSNFNRAALFGDGLFETMVYSNGKIRFLEDHLDRLIRGLFQLRIEADDLTEGDVLEKLLKENFGEARNLRVRWNVFRSGTGKYNPVENRLEETLVISELTLPSPIKKNSYISTTITVPSAPWSHCKTLNALTYVMANKERFDHKMDEVILTDPQGNICEAGSSNIFWLKNGVYFTPSLESNCIAGVGRKNIIQKLDKLNLTVQEGLFPVHRLMEAEKVFTSNVTGISYLANISGNEFSTKNIPDLNEVFV